MATHETEAEAAFARACEHDAAGEEAEAIPHYQRALALGLAAALRPDALVGLGSSLRNVGRHAEAVAVLAQAVVEFPANPALQAFLGLALYSKGDARAAVATLVDLAVRHAPVGSYARALSQYRDSLE